MAMRFTFQGSREEVVFFAGTLAAAFAKLEEYRAAVKAAGPFQLAAAELVRR